MHLRQAFSLNSETVLGSRATPLHLEQCTIPNTTLRAFHPRGRSQVQHVLCLNCARTSMMQLISQAWALTAISSQVSGAAEEL